MLVGVGAAVREGASVAICFDRATAVGAAVGRREVAVGLGVGETAAGVAVGAGLGCWVTLPAGKITSF